ncbi:CUB and sushi domain-containing protein 3 [Magallana gigas]|uniref:CUB and sushi domain-containing protein 3 n=1 Tax=Magallana gigas TaxID=29159 RepID=UPI003342A767
MDCLRDLLLFCHLLQIGFRCCLSHDDGRMGDIGFKCPSGSVFYQGYCFRKETVPMTWKHAETACLRSGMYLAWLENAIENEYVAMNVMSDVNQYWIGLSNTSSTAGQNEVSWTRYRISDDKTIPVYKGLWKNLQPADFLEENKCVSTLKDKYDNHWTITNCRKKLPFVCKLMGAPKPHDVIFCGNGGYIHKNWKCDGQNDCGDMSDEIDCSSSCSELLMLEKGTPGSITMTWFDNNALCTWTIQTPVGARIKITISSSFHLEENADVLSIWTGGISLKESNFLGSVTGSLQSQKEFYSQNNYIIMQLSMDGSVNVRSGFTVTYETVADSVIWNDMKKLTAGSSWQNLESPLYGTAVPFGLQLEWLITAGSYQVVSLEFLEVDLPTSSSLQAYDGEDLIAPQAVSSNKTPLHPIYISRSKSIRIVLSTDKHEYTKYRGFRLKYKEGCIIEMKQQGTIFSPGYKVGSYPSNVTCAWILTRNTGETKPISLRFTEFKLKSNSDYVELYNDTTGTALHIGRGLTGTSGITEIFSSTNGYLNVTFKSNLVLVEKGFKAEFSVDCHMLTLSQWTINSVSDKYTALNSEIELSCQPGYSFKQEEYNRKRSVALKCLPGGKWNVSRIPDCQITYCSTPPALRNGILISATGAKVGDFATYKCNIRFTLRGLTTIRCRENGNWETLPICFAQQCSSVSDPTNGSVNITEGSGTDFASVLMFSCDPGYDLLGSVYIHCRSNGTWSHPQSSCTEIKCPLPQVMYGKVESGGDVKYKETATLKCDAGFNVNGTTLTDKDVTCGSDALFSGLDPCVNKDECTGKPCESVLNTKCVDTVGSYFCKCKSGFSRLNSSGPCRDIDECLVDDGGCSDTCTNNGGSYSCSCEAGYELYAYPDFNNVSLADGETGTRAGDKIRMNHTCVRVQCPKLVSLLNGKILSNKKLFYYGDQIDIECDHGFFFTTNTHTLKCENHGQWSADMPHCKKGSCVTPNLSADPNYNIIFPNENTSVDFGTDVTIECRYGNGFRNLSLYCGESGVATYELLGDNLTCPVIDCGLPEHVPDAEDYIYTDTFYGSSFTFSCLTGSVRSGVSVNEDYTVTCQENRKWSFGNLTCTVGRCTDPGTPGGAVQEVRSYEAGELLSFKCLRPGYEPVPSAPLKCQQQGVNNATWNATKIPICTDVTPPMFLNCYTKPFYVDKMEATNFVVPTALDNSGLVKNVTVKPYNFKPGTVVSEDLNVTYAAVDNSGNSATCTISFIIKDRIQPGLRCPSFLEETINTPAGITVDLNQTVTTGATFYPNQFIKLNTSTLDEPRQVIATLQDKWGTSDTCTFLIYTKAEVCFKGSLPSVSNAARSCGSVGGNITCTYNCKAGYVYFDGTTSKQYHCSGANNWSPSASPEDCLLYETPSYKAKLEVSYVTTDTLASNCKAGFENMLVTYNTTIAKALEDKCEDLNPGRFAIRSFTTASLSFKVL